MVEIYREKEWSEVLKLFETSPFVVLSGSKGSGKSWFFQVTIARYEKVYPVYVNLSLLHGNTLNGFKKELVKGIKNIPEINKKNPLLFLKKSDIKNIIIGLDEITFLKNNERDEILKYCSDYSDSIKFLILSHPQLTPELLEDPILKNKSQQYILKPLLKKDIERVVRDEKMKLPLDTVIELSGGITRILFFIVEEHPKDTISEPELKNLLSSKKGILFSILNSFTKKQAAALFVVRNGLRKNRYLNEFQDELQFLQDYGFIDLTNEKMPINSKIIQITISQYLKENYNNLFEKLIEGDS